MSNKKLIEKKQNRLNRLVLQGSIVQGCTKASVPLTQTKANEQILQYAKLVCKILGE